MKKMKGVVGMETSPAYVNPKTSFKHQSLLQDYEELEKVIDLSIIVFMLLLLILLDLIFCCDLDYLLFMNSGFVLCYGIFMDY